MLKHKRNNDRPRYKLDASGYTLFELLVVLVIVGLIGGLALPSLPAFYDRLTFALAKDSVLQEIENLPYRMYLEGRDGILITQPIPGDLAAESTGREIVLDLPRGWLVEVDEPIHYGHDGSCSGGGLTVVAGRLKSRYALLAPFCRPRLTDE